MSIINNSYAIGVDSRNLVLKTRGTLHVKVGDKYYELDFRSLLENTSSEKEVEKEQYIIPIENKSIIDTLEYPGDNKLLIGTNDKTIFVTMGGTYIDISPENIVSNIIPIPEENEETAVDSEQIRITELNNVSVTGTLSGPDGMELDFDNNSISANSVKITESFVYPRNTVTTYCGKVSNSITDYRRYDFLELTDSVTELILKSGVMIKSLVNTNVLITIGDLQSEMTFVKDGIYMIYVHLGSITYTKL